MYVQIYLLTSNIAEKFFVGTNEDKNPQDDGLFASTFIPQKSDLAQRNQFDLLADDEEPLSFFEGVVQSSVRKEGFHCCELSFSAEIPVSIGTNVKLLFLPQEKGNSFDQKRVMTGEYYFDAVHIGEHKVDPNSFLLEKHKDLLDPVRKALKDNLDKVHFFLLDQLPLPGIHGVNTESLPEPICFSLGKDSVDVIMPEINSYNDDLLTPDVYEWYFKIKPLFSNLLEIEPEKISVS